MRSDYPRAREHFEHSLRLRAEVDDLPGMIASHNNLGYLWQLQSEYERAIEHYRIAEELAKKINLRFALAFAAGNAAYALISLGRYAEAEARCDETLALVRELNARHDIAQTHNTRGIVFYHKGEYELALAAYEESLSINRALGSAYQEANTLMHISLALSAQGRYAEAMHAADQALDRAAALGSQGLKVECFGALAEAALGCGDADAATAHATEAVQIGLSIGSKRDVGISQRLLGQAAAMRGEAFTPAFEESLALIAAIKDPFEIGRTWAAYGSALIAHGRHMAGRAYLKRARKTFISIGANGQLQRLASPEERSV